MTEPAAPRLGVRVRHSIHDIDAADWDACAGASNPFARHGFLAALEDSGSATAETGWAARHLAVEDPAGGVLAVAPFYLKSHSYGEYVFDHGWADAFERAGGRYYPKLQCAVPFTPVTGPRLMPRRDLAPEAQARAHDALVAAMVEVCRRAAASSVHVTFPNEAEWRRLGEAGFLLRTGCQFHWTNPGYRDFDDFLAALSARKRKAIRRERRAVAEAGIVIETLTGDAIRSSHWDAFFACYIATSEGKWGIPYLTRAFFERLGETLAGDIVLVLAMRDGRVIAGALNLRGGSTLYGRNWGALEFHRFLHFELCYYRAIDFAIAEGLSRVEAGAQGAHKIARGYLPERTFSAHWIAHAGLRAAVARFLDEERAAVDEDIDVLGAVAPFRKGGGPEPG